eukprot:TRINITY_DN25312_c0_g1_i1.p1 TRINITY_DN25312_c0_g1~~TRINITY_DN25312_c0_g1_i1.p1  ORF type:complete len:194 (+),score=23.99 TRINITY_DN25312_c0_g1_i1:101-682(+)
MAAPWMSRVLSFAKCRPVLLAGASLSCRYMVGDSFTQLVIEGQESLDPPRFATFATFGMLLGAGPLYFSQGVLIPRMVRNMNSNLAKCATFLAVDIGFVMPFIYFPLFYATHQVMHARHEGSSIERVPAAAYERWSTNILSDMTFCAAILGPQDVVMQMFVPPQWRIPFVSLSGVVWTVILSSRRGKHPDPVA